MFKKETEYALRAMVYIWKQNKGGRRPGIIETAEEILAPAPFVGKILQKLSKQGVISSQRGKGGGFYFAKGQSEILLKDIIVLIEGDKMFSSCGFGLGECNDDNPCPIHNNYIKVRHELENMLTGSTISDLAMK